MDSPVSSGAELVGGYSDLPPPYSPEGVVCDGEGSAPHSAPGVWPEDPPTYQDAMGGPAQLAHRDFIPACREENRGGTRYERFSELVTKVNAWLIENAHLKVTSCEVLKLKRSERMRNTVDPEASASLEYLSFRRSYVNGLRLWLLPKSYDEDPTPSRLGYRDIVPRCSCGRQVKKSSCQYQTLREAVDEFNRRTQQSPEPGRVLSVQTVVRYVADWQRHEVNTESTYWSESRQLNRYVYIIRVFYVLGEPAHQKIDFYDFKPALLKVASSLFDTHIFESFSAVYQKASTWASRHPDIAVIGAQTIDCKVRKHQITRINEQRIFNPIEPFFDEKGGKSSTALLQVLRVYYSLKDGGVSCLPPRPLTFKTFVPCQLVDGDMLVTLDTYETADQTTARMQAWLKEAGVDAGQVVSTETVPVLLYDGVQDGSHEKMLKYHRRDTIRVQLNVIRVYISGSYTEPPVHRLPPIPKVKRQKHAGCVVA